MERLQINCPWCDGEIQVSDQSAEHNCEHCGRRIDLTAQFCFLRGLEAFTDGSGLSPRNRKERITAQAAAEQTVCYVQAYSAIQQALQGELSDGQSQQAIEIMADIAGVFAGRLMTSPLEADYWAKLATQRNAQREFLELQRKLAEPPAGGPAGVAQRWRWRVRYRQLGMSTSRLERKIKQLEQTIEFTYAPHVH